MVVEGERQDRVFLPSKPLKSSPMYVDKARSPPLIVVTKRCFAHECSCLTRKHQTRLITNTQVASLKSLATLGPGPNVIKNVRNKLERLSLESITSLFQCLWVRPGSIPRGPEASEGSEGYFIRVGSRLCKHQTRLERVAMNKHSGLQ